MRAEGPVALRDALVRRLRIALALSLLLHVVLIAFAFHARRPFERRPQPEAREETIVIHDIPRPKRVVRPLVVVPPKKPPLPHVVAAAAPRRTPAPSQPVARARPRPRELAKIVARAPEHRPAPLPEGAPNTAGAAAKRPQISGQQIAKIEDDLGKAIDADRKGIDPLDVPAGAPPETKHYGSDYAAFTAGERDHHGLCDPVKDWTEDGWDYYYVACNVRFSDGTYERQSVPWPVRFPPGDDPFAGTSKDVKPLAMPLPGWHLPPGETVTVELREYAKSHGVDL